MAKTLLVAGKEFPDGAEFAAAANSSQRNVVITAGSESAENTPTDAQFRIVPWRKYSPVSAHSLIVETENLFRSIDETVLLFDEPWFTEKYPVLSALTCTQALDDMVAGFMQLTSELLSRYAELSEKGQKHNTKIIFAHRKNPAQTGGGKLSAFRAAENPADGILSAIGAGAFRALAENVASNNPPVSVILIEIENITDDVALVAWLFPYLDALPADRKQNRRWIKYGEKALTRLSFLW